MRFQTVAAIASCVIALINHPSVLTKAQSQVDAALGMSSKDYGKATKGLSRLPTFEDKEQMPYITALALESLRWRDATPLGELILSARTLHIEY
jgi:cytochrome P450